MHVTSPRSWLALVAVGGLLASVLIWSIFATVSDTIAAPGALVGGSGFARQAVVFVPEKQAVQIRPGMTATISIPTTVRLPQASVMAKVVSMTTMSADQRTLARVLADAAFGRTLPAQGRLVPIHLRLHSSAASPLKRGLVCQAVITIERRRVIQMVIP
jgi:hypothetical protein